MNVCEKDRCTGCMACVDICSQKAITIKDDMRTYNAEINEERCTDCGACQRICQNNNKVHFDTPEYWYQGWAENPEMRTNGSSGGVASAIMDGFINDGGYVCSCILKNGVFGFEITNDPNMIPLMRGSKYVKSDPAGIYKEIVSLLRDGKMVLFIGLPCQVEAVKRFVGEGHAERLYTVDMICHGTPSPKVLEIYLKQHGKSLEKLRDIKFRIKGQFGMNDGYNAITKSGMQDTYLMAFLDGYSYTENCYACQFAKTERVADLTLGDSWNSKLNLQEVKKGISLMLSQNEKGEYLLRIGKIHLEDVDIDNAIESNAQLKHPAPNPVGREYFMDAIQKGKRIDRIVMRLLPKRYFKQLAKAILLRLHILKRPGGGI